MLQNNGLFSISQPLFVVFVSMWEKEIASLAVAILPL